MSTRQLRLTTEQTLGGTKTITTTINNVNPTATSEQMTAFAKKLNSLTNNTYGKTDLVETTNIDTEAVKPQNIITFNSTSSTVQLKAGTYYAKLDITTTSGDKTNVFGIAFGTDDQYPVCFTQASGISDVYIIDPPNVNATYRVILAVPSTNESMGVATSQTQITVTAS